MLINVTTGRRTLSVRQKVNITPPEYDKDRGLRYHPDFDEAAHKAAKGQVEAAVKALREKTKKPELPVKCLLRLRERRNIRRLPRNRLKGKRMEKSNLSILQRNIIDALNCEIAAKAFLKACERVPELEAEQFALEVRMLVEFLEPALELAANGYNLEDVPSGLLEFILDRHWF